MAPRHRGQLALLLGRNLRRERTRLRLSQERFAELLEIHRTYVGALERGERNVSLRVIEDLARQLDLDPLELLRRDDDARSTGDVPLLRAARREGGDDPTRPDR